jgi:hypothetical protein
VRVSQRLFQGLDPPLHFVPFIDFFGFFHAYYLSYIALPILTSPLLNRARTFYAILSPDRIKWHFARLDLPHHGHFKGFTVSYPHPSVTAF